MFVPLLCTIWSKWNLTFLPSGRTGPPLLSKTALASLNKALMPLWALAWFPPQRPLYKRSSTMTATPHTLPGGKAGGLPLTASIGLATAAVEERRRRRERERYILGRGENVLESSTIEGVVFPRDFKVRLSPPSLPATPRTLGFTHSSTCSSKEGGEGRYQPSRQQQMPIENTENIENCCLQTHPPNSFPLIA